MTRITINQEVFDSWICVVILLVKTDLRYAALDLVYYVCIGGFMSWNDNMMFGHIW